MNSVFDTEHLYRSYFKMAFPVVLGLAVTLIYNLTDTFFIAQTNNTSLIAGVSVCSPVFTTLMAFGNIYGQGGSSLISRMLGQDDRDGVSRVSSFCFYISIATGAVLAVVMTAFRSPLLAMLGADGETVAYAQDYYTVLALCAPIVVLSFIHSNLIRCEGLSSESMVGTILGAVVNIILDPILISTLGMGALGAAIATVIGYFCSVVYFLWILRRKSHCLSVNPAHCRINGNELRQILGVGVTAALSNLMQSLTVIVINQYLLPYGNDKIAAMGIVLKVNMIAQLMLTGFAFGGVPLYGYLYGAKRHDALRRLVAFCMAFICALALVLTAFLCLASSPLMGMFVKDESLVLTGAEMLRWQAASTICAGIVLLLTVLFQATGKIVPAFFLSISRQGVVFLAVLVAFVRIFSYSGILMAQAAADVLSAVLALALLCIFNPLKAE